MNSVSMSSEKVTFPRILYFSDLRLYAYVSLFVALNVSVPWLCHAISPLAGPVFLPLFFFVLLAGILFDWRAGLLVGLLSPFISFVLAGMPPFHALPWIIIEAAIYGTAAGFLSGYCSFGVITSIAGAIIPGRLAVFLLMTLTVNLSHSATLAWQALKTGWPGILIQLLLVPLIVLVLKQLRSGHHHAER